MVECLINDRPTRSSPNARHPRRFALMRNHTHDPKRYGCAATFETNCIRLIVSSYIYSQEFTLIIPGLQVRILPGPPDTPMPRGYVAAGHLLDQCLTLVTTFALLDRGFLSFELSSGDRFRYSLLNRVPQPSGTLIGRLQPVLERNSNQFPRQAIAQVSGWSSLRMQVNASCARPAPDDWGWALLQAFSTSRVARLPVTPAPTRAHSLASHLAASLRRP